MVMKKPGKGSRRDGALGADSMAQRPSLAIDHARRAIYSKGRLRQTKQQQAWCAR